MTRLYGAVGSCVLLRLKNRVELFTQSAENRICMGKRTFEIGAIYFLKTRRPQMTRPSIPVGTLLNFWDINIQKESSSSCLQKINFRKKKSIIWPRTPSLWPGQSSLAPPMLVRWWQTVARWNRDTKGSLFLIIWQGLRRLTKIKYVSVKDKQSTYIACLRDLSRLGDISSHPCKHSYVAHAAVAACDCSIRSIYNAMCGVKIFSLLT